MTKLEKRNKWEERVSAFKESGQTQTQWCETNEVNVHQLRYWIRKFRSEKLFETSSPQWIPVEVDDQVVEEQESSDQANIVVKIGEAAIEIKSGFDPLLLSNVVKALSDDVR